MDAVAVMRALMLAHAPLATLVGTNIIAGTVPAGTPLPAVGIKEISRIEIDTVSRDALVTLITARVQVTAFADSYRAMKETLAATKLGPGVFTGLVAGVEVRSVLRDGVGPDLSEDAPGLWEQSRDFKVAYIEPN